MLVNVQAQAETEIFLSMQHFSPCCGKDALLNCVLLPPAGGYAFGCIYLPVCLHNNFSLLWVGPDQREK